MSTLTDRLATTLPDHLRLNEHNSGIINMVTTDGREMVAADVEEFRAALIEAGHVEVESWVATQGASWLSDGVFAGVSFRVRSAS